MVWFSLVLAVVGCATVPQSDVSAVDIQKVACERVQACDPDGFDAAYGGDVEQCVNAYDDTTSVCYDLYCDYDAAQGEVCRDALTAQTCEQIAASEEEPECEVSVVFTGCDQAAVDACISNLGDTAG